MLATIRWLALLLVAGLTACAQIPQQELTQYRSAFAEAHRVSDEILIDFALAIQAQTDQQSAQAAPRPSAAFSGQLTDAVLAKPDAIATRRLAFRTIAQFNDVLVTLAEGKSEETMRAAAGGFVTTASQFVTAISGAAVPGLSSVVGLVQTLAGAMERARLREEFARASRQGAPTIDKMLVALSADRQDHWALRIEAANARLLGAVDRATATTRTIRALAASHAKPAGADPLSGLQQALADALTPAAQHLNFDLPVALAYGPGTPFGPDQEALVKQLVQEAARQASAIAAIRVEVGALEKSLVNYGKLLEATRIALKEMVEAIDKPRDLTAISEDLFGLAFAVKRDIDGFRAALRTTVP
ncbi:hypothetical protein [Desertibaculum subflavum]|uniref:hypothetical protein n=1 Tax=Desertibaculum subflavum TaxID=2268458 RepID=UPI000E67248D